MKRMRLLQLNKVRFTISTAVHKQNLAELDGIAEIYHQHGARYLYLNPLAPYGRAKDTLQALVLNPDELRYLALVYYRLVSRDGIHSGNAYWQNLTDEDVLAEDFDPFRSCLHAMSIGTYVFSISARGECYLDSKMKSEGLLPLGNAVSGDFAGMWQDPRLTRLRSHYSCERPAFVDVQEVLRVLQ
jgi:MoaA/NifB/PqqE/SkfB family radical SAM enzyme